MAIIDFFTEGRTTRLSAVNTMLNSIGRVPVTALDPSQDDISDMALVALNEMDLLVQTRGMEANRETDWEIALTPEGYAVVPTNVLQIDATYCASYPADKRSLVQRGDKLYDKRNKTFDLRGLGKVSLDAIIRLDFDTDLPQHARALIAARAIQLFQGRQQTSSVIDRIEQRQVDLALTTFEQLEDANADFNMIEENASVSKALGRGRVWRR